MKKFSDLVLENVLFDSHAHLTLNGATPIDQQLENAERACVRYIFNMGTKLSDWEDTLKIAENQRTSTEVLPCLGIHPEEADNFSGDIKQELAKYKDDLFMIGEIGLDYYWRSDNKNKQRKLFEAQLEVAKEWGLPVSVHLRDKDGTAYADAMNILKEIGVNSGVVLHSYTGSYETLTSAIEGGYYIGVNGIVTYSKAGDIREMLKKYLGKMASVEPIDFYNKHILFETDSPLLRPSNASTSGRENEPANVAKVYQFVAKLVG